MKLKKINAVLALLTVLALLIHIVYNCYCYLTMYYNPVLKVATTAPFMLLACAHAVCGMCSVFLLGDGTRLDVYKRQNRGTVIQRVAAALIFPLLMVHVKTYSLLENLSGTGKWVPFALLFLLQTLFFGVVTAHIAPSVSRAFITLGILTDREKQKKLDRFLYFFCFAVFLISVFTVIRGELLLFIVK